MSKQGSRMWFTCRNTAPFAMALLLFALGCRPTTAPRSQTKDQPSSQAAPSSKSVLTTTVRAYDGEFIETIHVPGASVHGYERTQLMAEVGGQVKRIGSISDADGNMAEIDIGTQVKTGDVLAVLDVPIVESELAEKDAMVVKAESDVRQAEASRKQKQALMASAQAALEEAQTMVDEAKSVVAFRQSDYDNYLALFNDMSTTKDLLDKAQFQLQAAKSALKTAHARVRSAEKQLEAKRADQDRAEADVQSAKAGVAVAQAAKQRIEAMLRFATITAPFDGVVTKRMVDHGAFVQPANSNSGASALFEVTRNDKLRVRADVPARRAERIEAGQTVVLHSVTGIPGATIEGRVTRTAVVRDRDMRTLRIEVDLPRECTEARYFRQTTQNAAGKPVTQWAKREGETPKKIVLKPGMDGVVSIMRPWKDLRMIPSTALAFDAGRAYVIVVVDGICSKRFVDMVHDDTADVLISSGVEVGEQVAQSGVASLADGQQVVATAREEV